MPRQTGPIGQLSLYRVRRTDFQGNDEHPEFRASSVASAGSLSGSSQVRPAGWHRRRPKSCVATKRISEEERWAILRAKEIYEASSTRLENSVSDAATKKFVRSNRMRYTFVWIFLAMNGLRESQADYSSRIRDVIINAKSKAPPEISTELARVYDAQYAKFLVSPSYAPAPPSIGSLQLRVSIDIAFDEGAQTYRVSPVDSGDQDLMLTAAPFLVGVGARGTGPDDLKLTLQTPWTLECSGSSTVFLRGDYAGQADFRVDKSLEHYGRRHEIAMPRKLRNILKSNEPTDVKVHIYLDMHSLSVFLNQVLQYAFRDFRPVSKLHLACQFSKSASQESSTSATSFRNDDWSIARPAYSGDLNTTHAVFRVAQETQRASILLQQNVYPCQHIAAPFGQPNSGVAFERSTTVIHPPSHVFYQPPPHGRTAFNSGTYEVHQQEYRSASRLPPHLLYETQASHAYAVQNRHPGLYRCHVPVPGTIVAPFGVADTSFNEPDPGEMPSSIAVTPAATFSRGDLPLEHDCKHPSAPTFSDELEAWWQDHQMQANNIASGDLTVLLPQSPNIVASGQDMWLCMDDPARSSYAAPTSPSHLDEGQAGARMAYFPITSGVAGNSFIGPAVKTVSTSVEVDRYGGSVGRASPQGPATLSHAGLDPILGNNCFSFNGPIVGAAYNGQPLPRAYESDSLHPVGRGPPTSGYPALGRPPFAGSELLSNCENGVDERISLVTGPYVGLSQLQSRGVYGVDHCAYQATETHLHSLEADSLPDLR